MTLYEHKSKKVQKNSLILSFSLYFPSNLPVDLWAERRQHHTRFSIKSSHKLFLVKFFNICHFLISQLFKRVWYESMHKLLELESTALKAQPRPLKVFPDPDWPCGHNVHYFINVKYFEQLSNISKPLDICQLTHLWSFLQQLIC